MFTGFQTASGKEVKISEKALQNAKKLFEATSDTPSEVRGTGTLPKINGKSIHIFTIN